MALASYTLSPDGQASSNSGGDITSEWWSLAPETGIGNSYQAMATVIQNQVTSGTLAGIFGRWLAISEDVTWSVDSSTELEGVSLFIQIRESFTREVEGSATIVIGFIDESVQGLYYFPFNDPPTADKFNFFSNAKGTLDSPISLQSGDTISFTYQATEGTTANDVLISSADDSTFLGWDASNLADFSGFTLTVNGSAILVGGSLPNADAIYDLIGRYDFHDVVLTATGNTDINFISGSSGASNGPDVPIQNLQIVNQTDTFFYPIDNAEAANQPDSNGSGNNITLSTFSNFWNTIPIMLNQTESTESFFLAIDTFNTEDEPLFAQTSLRLDGARASASLNNTRYFRPSSSLNLQVRYDGGFTIEAIVQFNSFVARGSIDGNAAGAIVSFNNSFGTSLWSMRFDNWNDPTATTVVFPCFSLLERNTIYSTATAHFANNEADIRSTTAVSAGDTFHMLATIRASDDTCEFWLNGVSVGSSSFDSAWFTGTGTPQDNLLDGSKSTFLDVGACYVDGAWRSGQSVGVQDFRIHLLEADQDFATQQFNGNQPVE